VNKLVGQRPAPTFSPFLPHLDAQDMNHLCLKIQSAVYLYLFADKAP
jgi:hypothetical protein